MKVFIYLLVLLQMFIQSALADCPRIISQSPYITLQLEYLGLKNCIVGTSRYDDLKDIPNTGGIIDPDASAIAQLKPDLWITSVWTKSDIFQQTLPPTSQGLRLDSFQGMAQISQNLIDIAKIVKQPEAMHKAQQFSAQWQSKIQQVKGNGKKVLLLSSCTGQPYSFGNKTWLAELFTQAGFKLVDNTEGVRHLSKDRTPEETQALIAALKPDLIFVFTRQVADACSLIELPKISQLLVLNGDNFLHPAPVLLKGIDELIEKQAIWQ
ncbi:MAG: ABC transporter substrate-binding protein [Gammaproteobacteria bacterium]|nr:ABC transporter substrate-binding protein [Gammaproteobacteria bacterium]